MSPPLLTRWCHCPRAFSTHRCHERLNVFVLRLSRGGHAGLNDVIALPWRPIKMTDDSRWKSSFQRYKLAVSGRAVYTLADENVFICPPACCSFCVYVSTDRPDGASRSLVLSRKQRRARIDTATKARRQSERPCCIPSPVPNGERCALNVVVRQKRLSIYCYCSLTVLGSALSNGCRPAKRFVTSVCPLYVSLLGSYWFTSLHDSSTGTTFLLCQRLSWLV